MSASTAPLLRAPPLMRLMRGTTMKPRFGNGAPSKLSSSALPLSSPVTAGRLTSTASSSFRPPPPPPGHNRLRVGVAFTALTLFGLTLTSYGLYEFYTSFSKWPAEVRGDLRTALKAQHRGDPIRAEAHFLKALETSRSLPDERLGADRLLKTTGIAIALASLYEGTGQDQKAYDVLSAAFDEIRGPNEDYVSLTDTGGMTSGQRPAPLSVERQKVLKPRERLRAASIAQKLGDLAQSPDVKSGSAEEEGYLIWSLEELLKLTLSGRMKAEAERVMAGGKPDDEDALLKESERMTIGELELPPWVSKQDVGPALESLGQFYAREGNAEYAVPLYLQALSVLMPPSTPEKPRPFRPSVTDRCQAGIIMNNLAQVLVADPKSSTIDQAIAWAQKGLEIVDFARRDAGLTTQGEGRALAALGGGASSIASNEKTEKLDESEAEMCQRTRATLLFNLGVLGEMANDLSLARSYFRRAFEFSQAIGLQAGQRMATDALRRIDAKEAKRRGGD